MQMERDETEKKNTQENKNKQEKGEKKGGGEGGRKIKGNIKRKRK